MSPRSLKCLIQLLAILRAVHWSHWTAHWTVQGPAAYADHLLFQRLYEAMAPEVDTLGEKLVAAGARLDANSLMREALRFYGEQPVGLDPYEHAMGMEEHLQRALERAVEILDSEGDLSLGLEDYLTAAANNHETSLYLLGQKSTPASG